MQAVTAPIMTHEEAPAVAPPAKAHGYEIRRTHREVGGMIGAPAYRSDRTRAIAFAEGGSAIWRDSEFRVYDLDGDFIGSATGGRWRESRR